MWRIAASIGLMVGALAWSVIAMILIFLIVPFLWEALLGPRGAPLGALLALGAMWWCSAKLMHLADRLIGEPDQRIANRPALAAAEAEAPLDWHDYNAEIVRNKRWASYRRTHQYERLRELEEQRRASQS